MTESSAPSTSTSHRHRSVSHRPHARSNPAPTSKVFDLIRDLYGGWRKQKCVATSWAVQFQQAGGRCEACEGNGSTRLEMDFWPMSGSRAPCAKDAASTGDAANSAIKDKNIHDVLEMDVRKPSNIHAHSQDTRHAPDAARRRPGLHEAGDSPLLPSPEARPAHQTGPRAVSRGTARPYTSSTSDHRPPFDDIQKLLQVLQSFVASGNTVVVIEHNLDVVDGRLGPRSWSGGRGRRRQSCVYRTPEEVAACLRPHGGSAALGPVARNGKHVKQRAKLEQTTAAAHPSGSQGRPDSTIWKKHRCFRAPRPDDGLLRASGVAKSSLAAGHHFRRGPARYVESLSAYARQFLGQMQKPAVEHVSGLSRRSASSSRPPAKRGRPWAR